MTCINKIEFGVFSLFHLSEDTGGILRYDWCFQYQMKKKKTKHAHLIYPIDR